MKHILIIITAICLSACASPPQLAISSAPSGEYQLDPAHTSVVWSVSHAGLSNYTARFDTVSGALSFDPQDIENSRVDIRIQSASVSTGDTDFDETVGMGGRYFNAGKHPVIRFVSTRVVKTGDNAGDVFGDLSFLGVSREVVLRAEFNGAGKSFGHKGKTLGFSASASFSRSDFGLTHLASFGIGDTVSITIETEFNQN